MGNKSTFIILLMSLITFFSIEGYSVVRTKTGKVCYKQSGKYLCDSATSRSNDCVYVADNNKPNNWSLCPKAVASQGAPAPTPDPEELCAKRGPTYTWRDSACVDFSKDSADADGTTKNACLEKEGKWSETELPHCCLDEPNAIAKKACTPDKGTWNSTTKKCDPKAGDTADAPTSCGPNATGPLCDDKSQAAHLHCVCNNADTDGGQPKTFVLWKQSEVATLNKCPEAPPKASEKAEVGEKAAATGLACLQDIREKINACKEDSGKAVTTCDMKSDTNADTRQALSALTQGAGQLVHVSTAEQCKNMGLITGAAGYGLSNLQKNCNSEMGACRNSCSGLSKYKDADNVKATCATAATEDAAKLDAEAEELAQVMTVANKECVTTSEALLQDVGKALTTATTGYQNAAQCENQVSSQPVLTNMSLTSCISNPNAAGCPVNCATNPSNAQCTCLTNPTAAGCQGGAGSQMAGNPNGTNQNLASLGGGLGSKLGSNGGGGSSSSDLGDLSGLDGEGVPAAGGAAGAEKDAGNMFAQAGAANAGGGGGTEGGAGKGKAGKGGEAAGEEHGMFGGMFQNLKNAAGSLFGLGGSSSSTAKKSSSVTGKVNAAGLKPVVGNKALRGIASNGKSCFVDAKGTEFCFGKKNMDIFKMMNAQYNNQYNTLIIDK